MRDTPETTHKPALRAFFFHGTDLSWDRAGGQAWGGCPFCLKDKFSASSTTGLWDCKSCGKKGNPLEFVRQLFSHSSGGPPDGLAALASERGLMDPATLTAWGVCRSITDGSWLAPAYDARGRLHQIYRYVPLKSGGRWVRRWLPTPGVWPDGQAHGLFAPRPPGGGRLYQDGRNEVHVCEGLWDGAAWWETLGRTKRRADGNLVPTGSPDASLLSNTAVLAAPGCNVFSERWAPALCGKTVCLLYDNDHPRKANGKVVEPPALAGVKRTAAVLSSAIEPPRAVRYLKWGPQGYDTGAADGHDVRDVLVASAGPAVRSVQAGWILSKLADVPPAWVHKKGKKGGVVLEPVGCADWKTLVNSWRRAMRWTEGLDRGLSAALAVVLSTEMIGEPIWLCLQSPPSTGKTTLVEALSVARKYVYPKSTIRGFHSGYKSDKDGREDHSLIPKVKNKTLVVKDGDTILSLPNLRQVLAEARDLFDGTSRAHYRHGVDRDYEDVRMTFILCGTSALRQLDSSELGARFLTCVMMESVDRGIEDEVCWRVVNRAVRNIAQPANGRAESRQDEAMVLAKQLTGGYVCHLRESAEELLSRVQISEEQLRLVTRMGRFVAYMRARPSKHQDEVVEREFSPRLVEQFARMTLCLAAVLGKYEVDAEVVRRVRLMATDTARGRTLDLVKRLRRCGEAGAEVSALSIWTGETEAKERARLKFLLKIGAVEWFRPEPTPGLASRPRWRLSTELTRLYDAVAGTQDGEEYD